MRSHPGWAQVQNPKRGRWAPRLAPWGRARRHVQRSARSRPGPAGTARSWGREPAAQTSPHKAEAPSFLNDPGTFVRQEVTYTCLGPVCVSRHAAAHVRAHHLGRSLVCPEVTPATIQGDSWHQGREIRRPLQPGPPVTQGQSYELRKDFCLTMIASHQGLVVFGKSFISFCRHSKMDLASTVLCPDL